MKVFDKKMKLSAYAAILTIYNLIAFNVPFFRYVYENVDSSASNGIFIIASLAVVMLFANFFACYLLVFLLRKAGKVIVAIANVLSAISSFFVQVYKVILDDSMMGNVFNTNFTETSPFISVNLFLFFLVFGLIPSYWIISQKVDYGSFKRFGAFSGISLGLVLVGILLNLNNFLWIGKHDTQLGGLLMPWSYTVNCGRLLNQRHQANREEIKIEDAVPVQQGKTLVVLVIGESARKCNFSLYGYSRQTNPLLSKRDDIVILDAESNATYTTAATKCILEPVNSGDLYEILPNYAFRCGADVLWRSSNWGEPPLHIDDYENLDYIRENCSAKMGNMSADDLSYDGALLYGLRERIEASDKEKLLVIIHTSINHGPSYSKRYPSRFEQFTPVCDNVEEAENHLDQLINAYDNAIVYTDYFLDRTIDIIQSVKDRKSVMLFLSDHGESLGEDNIYMHGLPKAVAPKTQYEIPFIVWTTPLFKKVKAIDGVIDQHYVFHSIMDALGYESPAIDKNLSIFE